MCLENFYFWGGAGGRDYVTISITHLDGVAERDRQVTWAAKPLSAVYTVKFHRKEVGRFLLTRSGFDLVLL